MTDDPLLAARSAAPLSARAVEGAVVEPTIRVESRPGKLLMGVYDATGSYVDGTVLNRRSGEQGAPVPPDLFPVVERAREPEAIYAGTLYVHYGHFLLESLARAWYAQRHPDLPLVWAGKHDWQGLELRPWQVEILDLLGIANPRRVVADPTRYDLLHVPDIGYRYDDWFHPEHAAFLGRFKGRAQVRGRRLWLSRSDIGTDVRDVNAEPLERRLAQAGWRVVHPEALTVREQLEELCLAEVVAGEEGSAFHTLMLLSDLSGKKVHVLRRHGREHRNLRTVGDARGIDQTFHTVRSQVVLRAEGREVSKISPSSAEVLDVLGVPIGAADAPRAGPAQADDVLARALVALQPRRLLEVGAADAALAVGSTATTRVLVSTRLAVDPRTLAGSGVDVYELGLEQYADVFHEPPGPFDVIRLAGGGFEEVMESFEVSKRLAGPRTTWVLGTGDLAARTAVAVRATHPGYTGKRCLVRGRIVYLAVRQAGEPLDDEAVGTLTASEVRRRARWLRPLSLWRLARRRRRRQQKRR